MATVTPDAILALIALALDNSDRTEDEKDECFIAACENLGVANAPDDCEDAATGK